MPAANHLLAVDDQLGLADQHLPLDLKTQVGGGIEQPALDGMPDLEVKVAVRSNNSVVKIDDASLSALADDHFAFSKQPESEPSRADDDRILLFGLGPPLLHLGICSLKEAHIFLVIRVLLGKKKSQVEEENGAATTRAAINLHRTSSPSPSLLCSEFVRLSKC